ncbi:MAG: 50S ribosome-binding GTPase, partial [Candidatus Dependentiae bacterium]
MSKKHIPTVVLAGRTNVGKSTLFNRLTRRTESIVYAEEGITRDYLHEIVSIHGTPVDLVDTGGLSGRVKKSNDPFQQHIQDVGIAACERASVIVFVCDVTAGVLEEDIQLARLLQSFKKPLILALNKADNKKRLNELAADFYSLGCGEYLAISATHGTGVDQLLGSIKEHLDKSNETAPRGSIPGIPECKISLLGKPNVGKSSLMNALLKHERTIVSDMAGTTREAVSERFSFYGQDLLLTDTAGVRRKKKVDENLEELMVKSSLA